MDDDNEDYIDYPANTVYKLIAQLQRLVAEHPDEDFAKVKIFLNSEYQLGGLDLVYAYSGTYIDIVGG